jgi:hypothetical protein
LSSPVLFGLVLFGLVVSSPAQAALYKWTDASGKVHYTDQPPTSQATTLPGTSSSQNQTTTQTIQSLDAQEQAYQKRVKEAAEARAKADKETETARLRQQNCDKARSNLSTLQNRSRVYTTNAAGQRVYMDDAARANAEASSQKAVSENCR